MYIIGSSFSCTFTALLCVEKCVKRQKVRVKKCKYSVKVRVEKCIFASGKTLNTLINNKLY